ncbi:thioredoxin [Candidatus Protochlamydia phocaeensis]|uniref:thioredoxin n=1 Tax=Candidatus Protochlamydia phocaeensis TaxID=1414722 RepID=UPI00083938F1|nr:thioredoxin [Candidatus Protochlamydia phocaeensis]
MKKHILSVFTVIGLVGLKGLPLMAGGEGFSQETQPLNMERESIVELNSSNFASEVLESEQPVVVDVYADWCYPCQCLKPIFESVSQTFSPTVKFAKVNYDWQSELADEYNVRCLPTLLFFYQGEVLFSLKGLVQQEELEGYIQAFLDSINSPGVLN